MTRSKKMILNIVFGGLYQVVTVLCNFILPRYFLTYYGSEVNGLVSSINQFLIFITLCECGVGAVVQSAMYKPLAEKDSHSLSEIVISSSNFFRKIVYLLIVYTIALVLFYPFVASESFDYFFTATLIVVLAFSYFVQHYLFLTYKLLLNSDQLGFIQLIIHSVALILNTIVSVVLIKLHCSVHIVKLVSSFVFLLQPVFLKLYVDRKYNLNLKIKLVGEPIKQKWNGFAQHLASVVLTNTNMVVLTLFSTLQNVSVYSVYFLVVNGGKAILTSMTTGIQAMFGNMYVKNEIKQLSDSFTAITWAFNFIVVVLFTVIGMVLVPFVSVYTKGVTDANYAQPIFSVIITVAYGMYCVRIPYNLLIFAAGRYKETQKSSFIEAALNVVVSVLSVKMFGLNGVAIGTFLAMFYRTTYFAYYLSRHIIKKSMMEYFKLLFVDVLCVILAVLFTFKISLGDLTYLSLIVMTIKVGFITLAVNIAVNILFYRKMFAEAKIYLLKIIKR